MAALAVAGVVIYQNVKAELERAFPAGLVAALSGATNANAAEPEKPVEKDLASRSKLIVLRVGKGAEARPVVFLGNPTGPTDIETEDRLQAGILAREVVRQAILIAARDELGLATRDELLGDSPPVGQGSASAEVASLLRPSVSAQVEIGRGEGKRKNVLLKKDLLPHERQYLIIQLVDAAEKFSRTEFPDALRKLGVEGKPNALVPEAALPGLTEERLGHLGFIDPFAAVRDVHAAIHADGESPARLGALVRGYAMLGVLSEFQWNPAHKAFKARSLLYAQRLLNRDPTSPWALWHRAFASALSGMHYRAKSDLEEASTRAEERAKAQAGDVQEAPGWVALIDAYLHYDLARLKVNDGPHARLAALLRMFAVEFPTTSTLALATAKEVLAQDPECFRAHDVMCQVGGVANLHAATTIAPQVLEQLFPQRLRGVGMLPASVRDRIDRQAGSHALVESLARAGEPSEDTGEPGWGVLGHLARETRFVHVYRRLHFMRYLWNVPADDYYAGERPYLAQHHFRPYLDSLAYGSAEAQQGFVDSFKTLDLANIELTATKLIGDLIKVSETEGHAAWKAAQVHGDVGARDFSLIIEQAGSAKGHYARKLFSLNPENPFAMATLVEHDWEFARDKAGRWEKKAGTFPTLLGALGKRYTELGEIDKAQDYLTRYIRDSPDRWAYEMLAKNYRDRGDTGRWMATLEQFLDEVEDHGLDHARVRVEIANYHMGLAQWKKAQPYAEAAAETWANWAMQCAVRCYEGMKNWDRAELWVQRISERYPNTSLYDWIFFCKRTGHGNAEAARDFVEQYYALVGDQPGVLGQEKVGLFYWLTGSHRMALDAFRKEYDAKTTMTSAFALVTMADELGDTEQRDAVIDELATKHWAKAPKSIAVLKLLRDSIDRGEPAAPDLDAINRLIESSSDASQKLMNFYVGCFLQKHGKPDEARVYLERSTKASKEFDWYWLIANDVLRVPVGDGRPIKIDPRTAS